MKRGFLITGVVSVLAVLWFFFGYGAHDAPQGQPPLVHLNPERLDALRQHFNAASSETRVLVLLSPT